MPKTIVFNGEAIIIPDDLSLKLDLLMQVSDKRDNELADGIAEVNDRVTNLDLITGLEGLTKEREERIAEDKSLGIRIDTLSGNVDMNYEELNNKLQHNEIISGKSLIQGENGDGVILPGMTLNHSTNRVTVRFQTPNDDSFILKSITTSYDDIMSFRDTKDCMIWEKTFASTRGNYKWRDVITVESAGVDDVYFDGISSYFQKDGKLVIRGFVVSDSKNDWFGSRTNRGFRPQSALIVIGADLTTIESIDLVGDMGVVTTIINLGYSAQTELQRLDNIVACVGGASKGTYTGSGSWQSVTDRIPYGMIPMRDLQVACPVLDSTNNVYYIFNASGGMSIRQVGNNADKFFLLGGVQWATNDAYLPTNYASLPNWGV